MADINLPGKSLLTAQPSGGEISMQTAGAPYAAGVQLGQQIQGLGEAGMDFIVKQQRVENLRMANDMELKANEAYAAFQNEAATDQDPRSRVDRWQKRLNEFKSQHIPDSLAPEQQALIGERFAQFASNTTINVAKGALLDNVRQSQQSSQNLLQQKINMGDSAGAHQVIDDGVASHLYSKPDAEEMRMKLDQQLEVQAIEKDSASAPLHTRAMLDERNDDGTFKNYQNLNPTQRANLSDSANTKYRHAMADAWEDSQNLMADGKITTPEEIDKHYKESVSPSVLESMKEDLAKRSDARFKAIAETPEYQNQTVGNVQNMLSHYNPKMKGFDENYVKMDSLIRTLPEGSAARIELERQIKDIRDDKVSGTNSHFDAGKKAMQEAYDQGMFGKPVNEMMDTGRVIDSGFLANADNLRSLGIETKTADKIAGLWKPGGKPADRTAQIDALKALAPVWNKRGPVTADGLHQAAAEAILNGDASVKYISREAAVAAVEQQTRFGAAITKYDDWHKANPEAGPKEIDDKIFELAGEDARRSLSSGMYDAKPMRSTSGGPRVTSFGYPDDSTPDSNSKHGIGAWVGDIEASKIRAGEDTPNKMKEGDFAVSPDEEANLRQAGISPGDRVTLKVAGGGTISGRWMDRTAAEYNGKPLTGRYDIYSPKGVHALDGRAITGWVRDTNYNRNTGEFEAYNVR